jgi:hypothetical protein
MARLSPAGAAPPEHNPATERPSPDPGRSYNEDKLSLDWKYLIADPQQLVDRLKTLPQVTTATPRLFASGIVTLGEQSRGVEVIGIDPTSSANDPFRQGLVSGQYLAADDREGVLIGKPLADKLKMKAGDQINVLINRSDGSVDQQLFTIRGVYSTNTAAFDENTLFCPQQAQVFTGRTRQHHPGFLQMGSGRGCGAGAHCPGYQVLLCKMFVSSSSMRFRQRLHGGVVPDRAGIATVVTNTVVVFEPEGLAWCHRQKSSHHVQFLAEALLATGGVVGGVIIGSWLSFTSIASASTSATSASPACSWATLCMPTSPCRT